MELSIALLVALSAHMVCSVDISSASSGDNKMAPSKGPHPLPVVEEPLGKDGNVQESPGKVGKEDAVNQDSSGEDGKEDPVTQDSPGKDAEEPPPMKAQEPLGIGVTGAQEFRCPFHWDPTTKVKLRNKILDWMRHRQKSFNRFTVPVMGYTNGDVGMHNYTGLVTWIWVLEKHEYMLHYPLNFIRISAATMGIVTDDWALDYDKSVVPVSLSNFSFDIDDDHYEYEAGVGYCDPECIQQNRSCGIGKHDLANFSTDLTEFDCEDCPYEWSLLCLQLPYEDITTVMNSHPNFVGPDIFYYMLFIKKLFTEGVLPTGGKDLNHYQCYQRADLSKSKSKELMESYFVIPLIAFGLWLYSPLLVHYFPSSSATPSPVKVPTNMFPSHKSPNYLGRYVRGVFCYYAPRSSKASLVRLRRLLFLAVILFSPTSLFLLPDYGKFCCAAVVVLVAASSVPPYFSKHVDPQQAVTLMGWKVPEHLTRIDHNLKEYQLLAALMQERLYLVFNPKFWTTLINDFCYEHFRNYFSSAAHLHLHLVWGFMVFSFSVIVIATCYLTPFFYFLVQMAATAYSMTYGDNQSNSWISKALSAIHGVLIYATILSVLLVIFFWCYAFTEVSIFTLIGGAILPSMAFPYFILVGSIAGAVYALIHSLHEDYDKLIEEIVSILDSESNIPKAKGFDPWNPVLRELVRAESAELPSSYTISAVVGAGQEIPVMKHCYVATFLNRKLFDYVAGVCLPIHRQILFIVLQVVAILFYGLVVMWVKNVYHLEAEVDTIFSLVSIVAVAFVPGVLRVLAYKSYFGKKAEQALKQNVYLALVEYFASLD